MIAGYLFYGNVRLQSPNRDYMVDPIPPPHLLILLIRVPIRDARGSASAQTIFRPKHTHKTKKKHTHTKIVSVV